MLKQTLTDQIKNATKQRDSEEIQVQKKKTQAGKAEGELADANASIKANTEYSNAQHARDDPKYQKEIQIKRPEKILLLRDVFLHNMETIFISISEYLAHFAQRGT